MDENPQGSGQTGPALPSALERFDDILPGDGREVALFLDYDGTLTPIVERPEDAHLSPAMAATLERLAGLCRLAVISGRDLTDVRARVGIDGLWYAGSHGFDIAGPGGDRRTYREGAAHLPLLDAAQGELAQALAGVAGARLERKRFSLAVHFREVAEPDRDPLKARVRRAAQAHPGLRLARGKKVLELQPDLDWHKGKALRWVLGALELDRWAFVPIYIGDDVSDEDAFRELEDEGVGIRVGDGRSTRARYRLADPAAVQRFLERVAERLGG